MESGLAVRCLTLGWNFSLFNMEVQLVDEVNGGKPISDEVARI